MPNTIENRDALLKRLRGFAWLLDSAVQLPGTRFRVGLDALIGLVPGLGDVAGVLLSSYIVREAARAGAPASVVVRMAWNVAVEGIVGMIPFAGDVFDAAWKANQRNVALLEAHFDDPQRTRRSSRLVVAGLVVALIALLAIVSAASFFILRGLVHVFSG